jgi:hypothetical protein
MANEHIAHVEPAAVQVPGGRLRITPVATEKGRAAHGHFARAFQRHLRAVGIEQAHLARG